MTPTTCADHRLVPGEVAATADRISAATQSVIEGKPNVARLILTVLIVEGHALIEDVPGVGKTILIKALARSIDCSISRIQFLPDLLPSDITGSALMSRRLVSSSSSRARYSPTS